MSDSPKKFDGREVLQQLWNGDMPLFQAFWLYYFAVLIILKMMAATIGFLAPMLALLQLVWTGFMIKPIWKSADAYVGPKHWGMLAKIFAIILALGVVGEVLLGLF